jgi:proteasome accessory factor B
MIEGKRMAMPAVERLVNLTIALLETRRPLTFDELRRRTGYYPQADPASARRMFERDKETLRSFGVPIETRQDFGMEDPGYLIDRRAYELRGVDLDAEEVAALALAVEMLGPTEGALPLAKVAARAPDPAPLQRPPTRVDIPVTDVDDFAPAIVERRVVRFEYRTADGRTGLRTVEPYGIVRRRRAWYLVGRDRDRGQPRGFRTDRIQGALEVLEPAGAFEVVTGLDLGSVVAGPDVEPVSVLLEVQPEGRWPLEVRGGEDVGPGDDLIRDGEVIATRRIRVDGVDPVRDRAWLLGLSPDAAVHGPEDLRATLRRSLERVAAAHADAVIGSAGPEEAKSHGGDAGGAA